MRRMRKAVSLIFRLRSFADVKAPCIAAAAFILLTIPSRGLCEDSEKKKPPKRDSGFFNDDEINQGFFSSEETSEPQELEPEPEPEPEPSRTPTPNFPVKRPTPEATKSTVEQIQEMIDQADRKRTQPQADPNNDPDRYDLADRIKEAQKSIEAVKQGSGQTPQWIQDSQVSMDALKERLNNPDAAGLPDPKHFDIEGSQPTPTPQPVYDTSGIKSRYATVQLPGLDGTGRPTVSLVVRGEPRSHFLRAIDQLKNVAARLPIRVGYIYISGVPKDVAYLYFSQKLKSVGKQLTKQGMSAENAQTILSQLKTTTPSFVKSLHEMEVDIDSDSYRTSDLINEFHLEQSPAWIVEVNGEAHVYDGDYSLFELFDSDGNLSLDAIETAGESKDSLVGPVIKHESRGGAPFAELEGGSRTATRLQVKSSAPSTPVPPTEDQKLPVLPTCSEDAVIRTPLGIPRPLGPGTYDVTVFSPDDPDQVEQAEKIARIYVPYLAGMTRSEAARESPLLPEVLTQGIKCLPTRIHFMNDKNTFFREVLQGNAVWAQKAAPAPKP